MDFKTYFANLRKSIDKNLDKYLPKGSGESGILYRAMRHSVFPGGKRLRPILVIESAKACGAPSLKKVMPAACAVELIHIYSLVHDDLPSMDDDDYRRGKPACHKKFGEANAILAGDALLTLAFNIIAGGFDPKTGMEVIKELSEAAGMRGMVSGQVMDLRHRSKMNEKDVLNRVNFLKTAKLFEAAAKIGAITALAGKKEIAAAAHYGASLGMAFQIADDIADNEGYSKIVGPAKAREDAESLIKKAKENLKIFGVSARMLEKVADSIIAR